MYILNVIRIFAVLKRISNLIFLIMQIQVKYYSISTSELLKETLTEFKKDNEALNFLKEIDNTKMNVISKKVLNEHYKASLILKNANSKYGEDFCSTIYKSPTRKKKHYCIFKSFNDIRTEVKIN